MVTQTVEMTAAQITDLREIGKDIEAIRRDLEHGVEPIVSSTPNGRNILCVRGGFAVQPRNDNYWIRVASIDEAMGAYENPERYRD